MHFSTKGIALRSARSIFSDAHADENACNLFHGCGRETLRDLEANRFIIKEENMSDTIAAIATGLVVSAIGIVRVSGPEAIAAADRVFRPSDGRDMSAHRDRQLVYGRLVGSDDITLDWCLCTISRGPGSYTGEDTAELQCHGSPVVLRAALEALFKAGCRQAGPGEFTKRAFLNGRLDLTQAEAVIDIIEAETSAAASNAAGQLGGALSRRADKVYSDIVDIISHFDAVLDYPDEDLEPFELEAYEKLLLSSSDELGLLLDSFERGRILREGLRAAIIGRPNAGKSSLLNALLGYDRAIVTSRPGTTRDTIEEKLLLGGTLIRLTDTAGLRISADEVEAEGIKRALRAAEDAELIIAVFDGAEELNDEDLETIRAASGAKKSICVINKTDLPQLLDTGALSGRFSETVTLSAKTGAGLEELADAVNRLFPHPAAAAGEILTNARQAEAVGRAKEALDSAVEAMRARLTPDAVLTEAEQALGYLAELTGRSVRDDVTDRIFSRFCVGK